MARNKNITMKQFNGTDYDTLYPKTIASQVADVYSKNETLSNATKTLFGLGSTAIPDSVFAYIHQKIEDLASVDVKIAAGNYIGTGTYGASNPNSLTFDFEPKIVFFPKNSQTGGTGITLLKDYSTGFYSETSSSSNNTVTWGNKTISWYCTDSALYQNNKSGVTYGYVAIG